MPLLYMAVFCPQVSFPAGPDVEKVWSTHFLGTAGDRRAREEGRYCPGTGAKWKGSSVSWSLPRVKSMTQDPGLVMVSQRC